ncbi:MAG: glycoside hydrolase [Acidobacteriales bacterium]|nr:glycoside hydrolase [Terriglobales bacterium]
MKTKLPFILMTAIACAAPPSALPQAIKPTVVATPEQESKAYEQCRRALVKPGYKQPKAYPGYTGFVGWTSVTRTKTGALLVTFSSGYWHASPPTPITSIKPEDLRLWRKMGMPEVNAPRGGRAEIMRSDDGGKTWSDPVPMIDTEWDDRSPAVAQLPDGTLVASFFTYPSPGVAIIRSFDDGKTWEQKPRMICAPFHTLATDGPPLVMPDGSLLLAAYGSEREGDANDAIGIFGSRDRGETWRHLATIRALHELSEPGLARLRDGTLVVITRPEGSVSWSKDGGKTWTQPQNLPARMFDPWLLTLRDGKLLCLHGSYNKQHHGLRALVSTNGGKTWNGAGTDYGFAVDPSVYGYSRGVQLPDGPVYIVYQGTGGHKTADAASMSIYGMRLRVKAKGRGIAILPAPGPRVR